MNPVLFFKIEKTGLDLLNSALGKFHHLEGNDKLARQFLIKAHEQTNLLKEKAFIQKMIDKLK